MLAQTQELARLLPYNARDKFRYYLDYINDRLFDIALEERVVNRLNEIQQVVELVFFLRHLYKYFAVGYQNFSQALDFFEDKQATGFRIGTRVFTRQSSLTTNWSSLVSELEDLVDQAGLGRYVRLNFSDDFVLRELIQSLPDIANEDKTDEGN